MNAYQKLMSMSGGIEISTMGDPATRVADIPGKVVYKDREYSHADAIPMGISSVTPLAAGETRTIEVKPDEPFKIGRLVINSAIGLNFTISSAKIGSTDYIIGAEVSAADFAETVEDAPLSLGTIDSSQFLKLTVTNVGPAPVIFRATAYGIRLR